MAGNREQGFSNTSHDMSTKICEGLWDAGRSQPNYDHPQNLSHNLLFTWHKIFFILNPQLLTAQNAWKFLFGGPELTLLLGAVYIEGIDV